MDEFDKEQLVDKAKSFDKELSSVIQALERGDCRETQARRSVAEAILNRINLSGPVRRTLNHCFGFNLEEVFDSHPIPTGEETSHLKNLRKIYPLREKIQQLFQQCPQAFR